FDLPHATYLENYEVPVFLVDDVQLHFDLNDSETIVKSKMKIRHNRLSQKKSRDLMLNGEELTLVSIHLDGALLDSNRYQVLENLLIIYQVPDNFELETVVK